MNLDAKLMLSDKQDLAKAVGTYLCSRSINLLASSTDDMGNTPIDDPGNSEIEVMVRVTEQFDSAGGGAFVKAQLVIADNEALDSNLVILQSTEAIPEATLAPGYEFRLGGDLPRGIVKQYLGVQYVVSGETTTAGKVLATIASTKQTNHI